MRRLSRDGARRSLRRGSTSRLSGTASISDRSTSASREVYCSRSQPIPPVSAWTSPRTHWALGSGCRLGLNLRARPPPPACPSSGYHSQALEMADSEAWPALPLREWEDTHDTLHMWTQIVGKIRLKLTPHLNHWWEVPFYLTSRGLTTTPIPYEDRTF